jgi:hypothetical protein
MEILVVREPVGPETLMEIASEETREAIRRVVALSIPFLDL